MIAHLAMNSTVPFAVEFQESLLGERYVVGGCMGFSSVAPGLGHKWRSSATASGSRIREFVKIRQCCRRDAEQRRDERHTVFSRQTQGPPPLSALKIRNFCGRQLNFFKNWDFGSWSTRAPAGVHGTNVGVPSHEEPTRDEQEGTTKDHTLEFEENSSASFQLLNNIPEDVVSQVGGKAGSISFYTRRSSDSPMPVEAFNSPRSELLPSLIWLLGPLTLVASVVLPPLYLRRIFGAVLEDSLVTDFVILFFTETLFFVGASIFLYIAHLSRLATAVTEPVWEQKRTSPSYSVGYRLSAKIALAIGVALPVVCFALVWPWTGPAAAAALAPYMVGLLVQLGFEYITRTKDSPVWPLVPITFQMYRLHQLNRAAQLVAGLLFSLKGVEATAETMAINGSLQTLLFVLQVLGMLCLWSLGSFLTNQLPTTLGELSTPSLP